ncbi:Ornithine decarboxylase [Escherichia coli]|uniref:Ornithine decarboxylase n=1 Tax=Escherichia coli TaxID=562 RepID=A0A376UHD3_ECOLX|nr:Ornithine decarboxylase [Escherichia coli]
MRRNSQPKSFMPNKTYFVLNGTSAANKVVTNALLTRGDLVLFDRNNHKSNHHGRADSGGATPVYLEASRNPFGFIGGIDAHCFNEEYLRQQIRDVAPEKAELPRPFAWRLFSWEPMTELSITPVR